MREEKEKNKHVETMKKEHAKAIREWQWKVREKWSEDGGQPKTEADAGRGTVFQEVHEEM